MSLAEIEKRVDFWRRDRADVSYAAVQPSAVSVSALQNDARDLVAAAEHFVRS